MQLRFSDNTITGNLAGRLIHCVVRMSRGTGSPARGEYVIAPPASDAIYGQTALVIPLKQGSAGFAGMPAYLKAGVAQAALKMGFAPADKTLALPSGWAQTSLKMGYSPAVKVAAPRPGLASSAGGGAAESAGGAGAERQSAAKEVLVLSDKPIAGRNCLVASLGFADLMLGLQAMGGATLRVL